MKPIIEAIRTRRRGNALIETALATPMIILMLSGVIDFGRAYYWADVAASAARAGAQFGIESAASVGNTQGMKNAAKADAQVITAQGMTIDVTPTWPYCVDSSGVGSNGVSGVC